MPLRMPRFPSDAATELGTRWPSWSQKRRPELPSHLSPLHILAVVLVVLSSAILIQSKTADPEQGICVSHDQPNPLAELFPNNATGVLNATLVILPIPLAMARRLIPPQYGILERAYRALLPDFPEGMYPVMLQAAHDHDVQLRAYGVTLDDFSVGRPVGFGTTEKVSLTRFPACRVRVPLS